MDILHACGGNARCTTCRVEFVSGEPAQMTQAEQAKLEEKGLTGVRLSCQIVCDHDMTVRAISRLAGSGRPTRARRPNRRFSRRRSGSRTTQGGGPEGRPRRPKRSCREPACDRVSGLFSRSRPSAAGRSPTASCRRRAPPTTADPRPPAPAGRSRARSRSSRFCSSAPPPLSTMPRSQTSADSSGGIRSSASRTAWTICAPARRAPRASSWSLRITVVGLPSSTWRPLTSISLRSDSGAAEPSSILIRSAVRSPISRSCSLLARSV